MAHEILLVEDHRDIAEMVAAHLERDNFLIDYADNGNLGYNLGRKTLMMQSCSMSCCQELTVLQFVKN